MEAQKPTLQHLVDQALWNQTDLMRESGLSQNTIRTLLKGEEAVKRITLLRALAVINERLGTAYTPETVNAPYN